MSIWSIFRKKPEPLVIQDGLGVFTLEDPQKSRLYEGEINWLGQEVSVSLYCDDGALTAETALENLRRLMAEAADWDAKLRQRAGWWRYGGTAQRRRFPLLQRRSF